MALNDIEHSTEEERHHIVPLLCAYTVQHALDKQDKEVFSNRDRSRLHPSLIGGQEEHQRPPVVSSDRFHDRPLLLSLTSTCVKWEVSPKDVHFFTHVFLFHCLSNMLAVCHTTVE